MGRLLLNSAIVATAVAVGKIAMSILSAFIYFHFRLQQVVFWMIFVTLMLPVPMRLISTYEAVASLGLEGLIPRSGTELPPWNPIMAGAMMALLPPVVAILLMQRGLVKGLSAVEK
jgi:ABC-type glycerol-3-phosphate transport system permease component